MLIRRVGAFATRPLPQSPISTTPRIRLSACPSSFALRNINGQKDGRVGGFLQRRGGISSAGAATRLFASSSSNFGYPDAAPEVMKKALSYQETLIDEKDVDSKTRVIPIEVVSRNQFDAWLKEQDPRTRGFLSFKGEDNTAKHREGGIELIPSWSASPLEDEEGGGVDKVVYYIKDNVLKPSEPFVLSSLPNSLPAATYRLTDYQNGTKLADPTLAAFSWAIGTYRIDRYKEKPSKAARPKLIWPEGTDKDKVGYTTAATFLVRELINLPTECLGPAQLQETAELMIKAFDGQIKTIIGDDLLAQNYPQIHTVGRAAAEGREPRLIDMTWGNAGPKVTIVGKGVCYDTGGLDIKPGGSMTAMKKDMGGAAQVLGLAYMIMSAKLPVRLRVLVPAVENCVDARSYRNGDILKARNGKTSEITSTDAEGRLVLADALVEADSEDPDIIIDCATLTGASRVAMGTEIQSVFSNKESLVKRLEEISWGIEDPLWHMPLYRGYRRHLKSNLADMRNTGSAGSGVITAALYLEEFLQKRPSPGAAKHRATPWIHIDMNGANTSGRPGRPEGGEAQGMRSLFELIKEIGEKGGWPVDEKEEGNAEEESS